MPNLIFAQSVGNAIMFNGNAYQLVGTTTGAPTNLTSEVSTTGINGITYTTPDAQGKTVYTPGERAVSRYEYGIDFTSSSSTYSGKRGLILKVGTPSATDDSTQDYLAGYSRWIDITTGYIYVCSSAAVGAAVWTQTNVGSSLNPFDYGVVRVYGGAPAWYINGVSQGVPDNTTEAASTDVANIIPGDYVSFTKQAITQRIAWTLHPMLNP